MPLASGVQAHIIIRRLDPLDITDADYRAYISTLCQEPLWVWAMSGGCLQSFQNRRNLLTRGKCLFKLDPLFDSRQSLPEALPFNRLYEVVQRVDLKCFQRATF